MFDLDLGKNYLTLTLDSVVGGKIKEIQHKQSRTEIQYENSPGYPNYITTEEVDSFSCLGSVIDQQGDVDVAA